MAAELGAILDALPAVAAAVEGGSVAVAGFLARAAVLRARLGEEEE